jgi:hypothetical protein
VIANDTENYDQDEIAEFHGKAFLFASLFGSWNWKWGVPLTSFHHCGFTSWWLLSAADGDKSLQQVKIPL